MTNIKIKANAKINLALDIIGRLEDGYHDLEMVMQSVGLADELELTLNGSGQTSVVCDDPSLPQGHDNLAGRAAEAFFAAAGVENPGVHIRIAKRIPSGAGLGGGSADAAGTLLGLQALLGIQLRQETLTHVALSVGADVPFCLAGGCMLVRGVGEKLSPLPPMPDCAIIIIKPEESICTSTAYMAYDLLGVRFIPHSAAVCEAIESGDLPRLALMLSNHLEAASGLAVITRIKKDLLACGAVGACMTGSGSAVFGLFSSQTAAYSALPALQKKYNSIFLCQPAQAGCFILSNERNPSLNE